MLQVVVDFGTLHVLGLNIPVRILGYGLMIVLGFACGIVLAQRLARRAGENPEAITHCGILALIGGIAGARIYYILQHWKVQFRTAENQCGAILNITSGGLIYYGGVALGTAAVLSYLWAKRYPIRRYLDLIAASLMVGLAFGRVGCLLNGCCYAGMCRQDWPLGMRFPMYSRPLLKFTSFPGPFSESADGPSPVYSVQFGLGEVRPDERLVWRWGGKKRIRLPRELHGRLEQDQLEVMFSTDDVIESKSDVIREKFEALAGSDGRLGVEEWRRGLAQAGGLLRGSEHWEDAVCFDASGDDLLSLEELGQYLHERKLKLAKRFGSAEEREQAEKKGTEPRWRRGSGPWKQADAYLREGLFALAEKEWSKKVKPAQVLGIVNALLIAGLLLAFRRLRTREGQVFALMLVLYPITRFVLESIREDNPHTLLALKLTHNQWISLAMAAAGVLMFLGLRRLRPSAGPFWAERLAQAGAGRGGTKARRS